MSKKAKIKSEEKVRKELMAYAKQHRCIKGFEGAQEVTENILTMNVDILMPCALENQ